MKSSLPKVLHKVGGLPMLGHVLRTVADSGAAATAVVLGPNADEARSFIGKSAQAATAHEQTERRGTAHAVLAAENAITAALETNAADDVLVLYADTPLVTATTLAALRAPLADGAAIAVAGFRPPNPTGYGRLVERDGVLVAIVEEKDATAEQKKIGFCNGGLMAFRGADLLATLKKIGNANAKGEYYLTDAVELATRAGERVVAVEIDADEVAGVNSRRQLAEVEAIFQQRRRAEALDGGVTMTAPDTVWFSHDTKLGRDVTIEPNVFFGPGVTVADNVTIKANCHFEGAEIAEGAIVGPFARLRPGARIGPDVHIGNFVEVKNGNVEAGAKINHLTYIGDARVGAKANVGAGTITANYDGYSKHHTDIGAGTSIGSNVVLVAPVTVGDGASIAAGSVITRNVPADALAVARGRQEEKPGWAKKFREFKELARKTAGSAKEAK